MGHAIADAVGRAPKRCAIAQNFIPTVPTVTLSVAFPLSIHFILMPSSFLCLFLRAALSFRYYIFMTRLCHASLVTPLKADRRIPFDDFRAAITATIYRHAYLTSGRGRHAEITISHLLLSWRCVMPSSVPIFFSSLDGRGYDIADCRR